MREPPPDRPDTFVHGFTAGDWMACWNMSLQGTLASVDFLNESEFKRPGVRELALETLRTAAFDEVALSSRMTCLQQAAVVRGGGKIGEGAPPHPFREYDEAECERVVRQADLELRFEAARRRLAEQAPSRISCLYLAEASPRGRSMVEALKGYDSYLLEVRILACARLFRADARWLEGSGSGGTIEDHHISGYWSGSPRGDRDGEPMWEFLLDGVIGCVDEDELSRLREWAPEALHRADGTSGPIGTPRDLLEGASYDPFDGTDR